MIENVTKNYLSMFNKFFSSGRMSSTYKAVFLRALLDLGDYDSKKEIAGHSFVHIKENKISLDLDFIAIRFLKYYWDMHHSFKIRQSQDPSDANILKIIKRENVKFDKPPTLKELDDKNMAKLRMEVIKRSILREVIPHLQNDMPELYNKVRRKPIIELDKNIIEFLSKHNISLKNGINYKLATYLERINKTIPQIANKVDINIPRQHLVTLEKEFLETEQSDRCYYCDRSVSAKPQFLRARFLEDAEPVVIVIDYNVIARSLFGSSFAIWSILRAICIDHNDGERLLEPGYSCKDVMINTSIFCTKK